MATLLRTVINKYDLINERYIPPTTEKPEMKQGHNT